MPQVDHMQKLTVPDEPEEVSKVAQSFNQLLARQHQAIQREKDFVANASHELKTPLAGILGHANLIRRHGEQHPEVVAKSLQYIDQEAQRMSQLVNELLLLEGHHSTALAPVDLTKEVQAEVASLKGTYRRDFITELAPHVTYEMTPGDFRSLAHNLLDNAAKYSPTDSSITVRLAKQDHQVVFTVADQGRGIAVENRQRIFERFYREDASHSSDVPGSGIGLAIVKTIIEKYHGKITVQANTPRGTIFTVCLPQQK